MQDPAWPSTVTVRFPVRPGRAKARRLLLEQLRQAITTEPAALDTAPDLTIDGMTAIRGRISILVGTIVVRLNREGFAGSERIYSMRDCLAAGRPVEPADVSWIEAAIETETAEDGRRGLTSRATAV
ncbi:MAG TPA: hypothetical protein VKT20_04220 [Candidatus Dormibacteraeota bacterium]|nr:hypothetical protein [Candidatus Dormibacteraeota bacterium]